jgi:type I restriction enzyme R subunit
LFAELGWTTVSALEETFGATGTLLRETKGEVVLVFRLRAALERLNPALPPEAITAAVDELTRDLEIYRKASISEIHGRIGKEIPRRKLQHELKLLLKDGKIGRQGTWRHTVYLWTKKA